MENRIYIKLQEIAYKIILSTNVTSYKILHVSANNLAILRDNKYKYHMA